MDRGGWVVVGTAERRLRRRRLRFSARGRRMRLGAGRTGKPERESREEARRMRHRETIRGVRRRHFVGSVDDAGVDARGAAAAAGADGRRRPSETEREEDAGGEVVQPRERGVGDKTRAVVVMALEAPVGTRIERKRSGFRR